MYLRNIFMNRGDCMAARTNNKTPLGRFILKTLYLKGKNQAWLAEQIQVKPNHICILCSKVICPKPETLFKLADALDVSIEELYRAVAENAEIKMK